MALLPPRIGKVHEDRAGSPSGKPWKRGASVFREDSAARPETAGQEPIIDDSRPLASDLEPHDSSLGRRGEALQDEGSSAGSNLYLHGAIGTTEQGPQVELVALREDLGIGVRALRRQARSIARTREPCTLGPYEPRGRVALVEVS